MIRWASTFLALAINAGALGFTGIAAKETSNAKILFVVFLLMFFIVMIYKNGIKQLTKFSN